MNELARKVRAPKLNEFETAVIRETARLSRFHGARLHELLAEVMGKLSLSGKASETTISRRSFYRALHIQDIQFSKIESKCPPGTLSIHGIPVIWREKVGEDGTDTTIKGFILAVMDCHSGFMYAKAVGKLEPKLVINHIEQFKKYSLLPFDSYSFVVGRTNKKDLPTAIGRGERKDIDEYFEVEENEVLKVLPPTNNAREPIAIPGTYNSTSSLNRQIKIWLNKFNCGEGKRTALPLHIMREWAKQNEPDLSARDIKKKALFYTRERKPKETTP